MNRLIPNYSTNTVLDTAQSHCCLKLGQLLSGRRRYNAAQCQLSPVRWRSTTVHVAYRVFTQSSKRPALTRVFWIHLVEVCWTFAGSCKHPITPNGLCELSTIELSAREWRITVVHRERFAVKSCEDWNRFLWYAPAAVVAQHVSGNWRCWYPHSVCRRGEAARGDARFDFDFQ